MEKDSKDLVFDERTVEQDWDEASQFPLSMMSQIFHFFLPERHLPIFQDEEFWSEQNCSDDVTVTKREATESLDESRSLENDEPEQIGDIENTSGEAHIASEQNCQTCCPTSDSDSDSTAEDTNVAYEIKTNVQMSGIDALNSMVEELVWFHRVAYKVTYALTRYFPETEVSQFQTIASGSSSEGLTIPPHTADPKNVYGTTPSYEINESDLDLLIVAESVKVGYETETPGSEDLFAVIHADIDRVRQGFVRLSPVRPSGAILERCIEVNGKPFLSSSKLLAQAHKEIADLESDFIRLIVKGPAHKILIQTKGEGSFEFDLVLALPCITWPAVAEEWVERNCCHSNWPSTYLVSSITSDGCLVVPTAHDDSPMKDVEWRLSFSKAEQKLAHSLSTKQRQAYILLKILLLEVLGHQKDIRSYHIKTTLFWMCEQVPEEEWCNWPLAKCVLLLLDRFIQYLKKYNIPLYFIPANNLIERVPRKDVDQLLVQLEKIREKPLQRIFEFDRVFKFVWSLMFSSLEERFGDLLSMPHDMNSSKQDNHVGVLYILARCFHALLDERRYDRIMETAEDCANVIHTMANLDEDPAIHLVISTASEMDLTHGMEFYRLILSNYPETEKKSGILMSNLACFLHAAAQQEEEEKVKEELLQDTENAFQQATSGVNTKASTLVDYATFLCKVLRFDDALSLLHKTLVLERDNPSGTNSYGEQEKLTLDNDLQEFVDDQEIESLSIFFAYYLLVKCYVHKGLLLEARDTTAEFSHACDVLAAELDDPSFWILLGLTHFSLQDYLAARTAFSKMVEEGPGCETAANYVRLCDDKLNRKMVENTKSPV